MSKRGVGTQGELFGFATELSQTQEEMTALTVPLRGSGSPQLSIERYLTTVWKPGGAGRQAPDAWAGGTIIIIRSGLRAVTSVCDPSTWEAETGNGEYRGQFGLYDEMLLLFVCLF